jgi:hypothetical protein
MKPMERIFYERGIVELVADGVVIRSLDDALDLLFVNGCSTVIIRRENLAEEFFDLTTGFAGEILQKFSNYRMRLAVIGDYSDVAGKALRDFIRESNRTGRILFVESVREAVKIFNE